MARLYNGDIIDYNISEEKDAIAGTDGEEISTLCPWCVNGIPPDIGFIQDYRFSPIIV
ncbi:MAG: hypothetical protein RIM23_05085 [Coleofasciculus sp. G3-WIS-01]|uniref:hypothetical protein n=1 Tax=Coleofasciculus sp. G3-WIS-01 TaxID=3069528 RepID=UPI0032FCEF8B